MKKIGFFGFLTYPEEKILKTNSSPEDMSFSISAEVPPRRYQKSQKINIFHSKVSCKLSPLKKLKKFDSYVFERFVNILHKR